MPRPKLKDEGNFWEVVINPDLEFFRAEQWKRGIKRFYGWDPKTKTQKLMFVHYPKSEFSRSDMKRILPKYDSCPLCTVGKKFINGKNQDINMTPTVIDVFGKIPVVGNWISKNRDVTEPAIIQLLASLSRYPVTLFATPAGKALISFLTGIGGLAATHYLAKSPDSRREWADFFANYLANSIELQKSGGYGIKAGLVKMINSIRAGNFSGAFNNVFEPGAIAKAKAKLRGLGFDFKNFFDAFRGGRLRLTETTIPVKTLPKLGTEVKYAEDYGYIDTSKRFRDISDFGRGFRSKRRLRESGDILYSELV